MEECVYCHYDSVDSDICPKCKNPIPDSRTILIGNIERPTSSMKKVTELPTEVHIDRSRRYRILPRKRRYPIYVWGMIAFIMILGVVFRAHDIGEGIQTSQTGAAQVSQGGAQTLDFDADKIDSDGKSLAVFVGKNVGAVRRFADSADLYLLFHDTDGLDIEYTLQSKHKGHGSWMDLLDPYFVCGQSPLPGVPLDSDNNKVTLNISMDCKNAPVTRVVGDYKKIYGVWGPEIPPSQSWSEGNTFEGRVVSVARTGLFDGIEVKVETPYDLQTIELGDISQASDPCPTKHKGNDLWDLALKQVQDLLPGGMPVTFTYTGSKPAVIWTLQIDDATQTASPSPMSVNEQLVAKGFWEPDAGNLTTSTVLDPGAKWKLLWPEDASEFEKALVKQANSSIKSGVGPIALCKK